jgi:hypothetical protein
MVAAWQSGITGDGWTYAYWGADVPGIPRTWLDSIIYLYPTVEAAMRSDAVGGTGFLMSLDPSPGLPPTAGHMYAVTNAHVIEGGNYVVRFSGPDGQIQAIRVDPGSWRYHPDGDDLALATLLLPAEVARTSIVPFEMSVTPEVFEQEQLGPGDEAFFIGRFVYRDGGMRNTPTARFGAIAQVGGDPILQERTSGTRRQESLLVECHSLSGFSGSPVFAYRGARFDTEVPDDPTGLKFMPQVGTRVYLLGVDWGSDPWRANVLDAATNKPVTPKMRVEASSGMALVVPAWKLRGAMDDESLVEGRIARENAWREKVAHEGHAGTLDATEESGEFGAFEDLAKKLLGVPKAELDEKLHEGSED